MAALSGELANVGGQVGPLLRGQGGGQGAGRGGHGLSLSGGVARGGVSPFPLAYIMAPGQGVGQ